MKLINGLYSDTHEFLQMNDAFYQAMKKYPQYQLAKHKGYPTALHLKLIEQYGVIPGFYRFSYKPVKNAKIAEISK